MRRVDVRLRWDPDHEVPVGTLAEVEHGRILFQYTDDLLRTGLEISPWKLPAAPGLLEHTERSFGPLFGVFDDSLPDGWGLLLMDREFRRRGRDPRTLSPLERLLYLGSDTVGALTYHPSSQAASEITSIDLIRLADSARCVLRGTDGDVLPELRRLGGSPGGARPKVLVGVRDDEIISGVEDLPTGWEHWLVKFSSDPDAFDVGPLEEAYMAMAELAGLDVPAHRLFTEQSFFGVRRFDRGPGNVRLHMHSLGGLIQSDYRLPSCDYDLFLRVARRLTNDQRAVVEGVRRMVFNVVAHNRDDHVKNFAFLMNSQGEWRMSPAYDLSYAIGPGGEHTMTIDGEGRDPDHASVVDLAMRHGLGRSEVLEIIDRTNEAVRTWPTLARDRGCPPAQTEIIERGHRFLNRVSGRPGPSRGGRARR